MLIYEMDKQIDQMLGQNLGPLRRNRVRTSGEPPKPIFSSAEHERIADAFFRPDAETLTSEDALSRRIQVINDLVAFSQLEEPSLRVKMCMRFYGNELVRRGASSREWSSVCNERSSLRWIRARLAVLFTDVGMEASIQSNSFWQWSWRWKKGRSKPHGPCRWQRSRKQQQVCTQLVNQGILNRIPVPLNSSS